MAKIEVDIGVKTSRFKQGLDQMRSLAENWSKHMGKIAAAAVVTAGAVRTGRAVAATMHANQEATAAFADQINDMADITGESTTALQELAYVAGQTAGDLETYYKGLKSAQDVAQDAMNGDAEALAKFADLKLDPKQFFEADLVTELGLLADAFAEAAKQGNPLAQFLDILGPKAKSMVAAIRPGRAVLEGIRSAAPIIPESKMKELDETEKLKARSQAIMIADTAKNPALAHSQRAFSDATEAAKRLDFVTSARLFKEAAEFGKKAMESSGTAPDQSETGGDRAKRRMRKKEEFEKLTPAEKTAFEERLRQVSMRNQMEGFKVARDEAMARKVGGPDYAAAHEADRRISQLLDMQKNEHLGKASSAEAAGDARTAYEERIKAMEMEPDILAARKLYLASDAAPMPSRSVVASSLQEVGGGGRGVIFGGADQAIMAQANDVKAIREMFSAATGRSTWKWPTMTPGFQKMR